MKYIIFGFTIIGIVIVLTLLIHALLVGIYGEKDDSEQD